MYQAFNKRFFLEDRKKEFKRIQQKYPDRIPVIVERSKNSDKKLPELDKQKFLVPKDLTVGQFLYVIRKRLELQPEHALFIFCNHNILPPTSELISQTYEKHKDTDSFLYLYISSESVFG